jgi:hypothetical protein
MNLIEMFPMFHRLEAKIQGKIQTKNRIYKFDDREWESDMLLWI